MAKTVYLDFEFHSPKQYDFQLVSVASITSDGDERSYWLHVGGKEESDARDYYQSLIDKNYVFVAYVMEAEARSLLRLGCDLTRIKTIDLYLEYRNLLNHNHELQYGRQLIDGRVRSTTPPPPKWERIENEDNTDSHHKPEYSLAAATYKLLGVEIDTKRKDRVRDIIIEADYDEIERHKDEILTYNLSDIAYLKPMLSKVHALNTSYGIDYKLWLKSSLLRGEYAVSTAKMSDLGYPVNVNKIKKFIANSRDILNTSIEECIHAAQNDEPTLSFTPFCWNPKTATYVMAKTAIIKWITSLNYPYWRKTEGGQCSASKDAFADWFDSRSDGFAGAFCRYLKVKQSMNGFLPQKRGKTSGTKNDFWRFVGDDGRVRPFFGIYGSQSSRSQPAATGFIPLKSHWMRNFIEAPEGSALCGIDYSSQEFLISAILSQDKKMMEAYESGDVYLAFGKSAKLIPESGTKVTHKSMRDVCKALVLGISYDMTAKGLAPRLSREAKETITEDTAQRYIDIFYETYPDFAEWKSDVQKEYREMEYLMLPDGWTMWGDNDNFRSVGNFPVQGHGAVIMREAVKLMQKSGIDVVFTLHDAIYFEYPAGRFGYVKKSMELMSKAFSNVLSRYGKIVPIRMEGETWSKNYTEERTILKTIKVMNEYVDEKGAKDLAKYKKYLI